MKVSDRSARVVLILAAYYESLIIPYLASVIGCDPSRVLALRRDDVWIERGELDEVYVDASDGCSDIDTYLKVEEPRISSLLAKYYDSNPRGRLVELGVLEDRGSLFVGVVTDICSLRSSQVFIMKRMKHFSSSRTIDYAIRFIKSECAAGREK
ncbi:hypothetical protein M2D07_015840 [Pseudomonas sp. BGr12]|uniref:hypothetical protein n=1 Tax=Pseudomonas sp. BGr12 TaxID=2936269 RepID=UPI00255A1329|nr:hypothetical protein [Pseudomonas sp. BJa5]MDL2428491.1 hypothetical protein [Pseudomonas sp. BJa5]